MNSFLIFSQEHRSIVRRQHPNLDNRAVSKVLGDKWTKLSEDEKRIYSDRANQVLVTYSLYCAGACFIFFGLVAA